jgi:hypothetical protein
MFREILPKEIKLDKVLGYEYFIDLTHPLSSKNVGKVYYHRHVASLSIGRWLHSFEVVHHKDGNKSNNTTENLEILSAASHQALHSKEQICAKVSKTCPVCDVSFTVYRSTNNKRVTCSTVCANKHQVRWNISKEELEILIWNKSYSEISKIYPISDVGAKKKAKTLGCILPPPYFFNKTELYRQEQRKLHNISDLPTQQSSKLSA